MSANEQSVLIPLERLESEHDALIIDKALDKLTDLTSHRVELNNLQVVLSGKNLPETIVKAVTVIRDLGYNVPTVKRHFPVLNMSCASCASSSQTILQMQQGVVSASVNYGNGMAVIEYIPSLTSSGKLKSALQSVGYDLLIEDTGEQEETLESLQQQKFQQLKFRTLASVSLSLPLVIIAMTPALMNLPYANYWMWALSTPVVLWFGRQFFTGAWKQARHRSANMDTLVAVSTGVAYLFSVFNTLFPHVWHKQGLHGHVYFETASVVISFILLGKLLEERARGNTSFALKKLMGLQPKTVTLLRDGAETEWPVSAVQPGDMILVKPGERIAVDGVVVNGHSWIDESSINGEPLPVEKSPGSPVFAGTVNQQQSFHFLAEKVGGDTLLAHIIKTVRDAQGSKAPVQRMVDRVAGIFVPVVILVALLSFLIWILWGGEQGLTHGLLALITVLVVACPCALGLATPTAVMVGIGRGAESGILIKDAEGLEQMSKVNAVVLDKTGTLTQGKPAVTEIRWFETPTELTGDILYSMERSSDHPLARAIVQFMETKHRFLDELSVENLAGSGLRGQFDHSLWLAGTEKLITENGIPVPETVQQWITTHSEKAHTVVLFAGPSRVLAGIALTDTLKPTSAEAVSKLKSLGIEVHMLTGDNEKTAAAIAHQTGITQFRARVLPSGKADYVKELQSRGKVVAMIGDGINDSAALAMANVSIAMGQGSDIAMDTAKMTIISGDLLKIPVAIKLSALTVSTIRQNLFWAFIYNIIGIPVAAGILYPFTGFLLNPMIAGAAMALSSVSVVSNSLLLKLKSI